MGRGNPLPFGGGRKRPNLLSTLLCNVFFYRTRRRISDTANKIAIGPENMMFPVMRLKKPFMVPLTLPMPQGRGFSVQPPLPAPARSYTVSTSV